jgi:hypothetical protein
VGAEQWTALTGDRRERDSSTNSVIVSTRRHAVADHLSISSLTERLSNVTAPAVARGMPACIGAACRAAPPGWK